MIKIEKLDELKPSYNRGGKDFYEVAHVLSFYIENNNLICPLDNCGSIAKMKCFKKYDNKYKIFGFKTLGILSHTVYFLLDIENNKLYLYDDGSQWSSLQPLKDWVEYLLSGGSVEKAVEENNKCLNEFDPTEGI